MAVTDHLNHTPSPENVKKIEKLRLAIINLDELMDQLVPNSRELSLAKTKLEETRMWAVKGIVMQDPPVPINPQDCGLSH